ncbi:ABC transporter permease [bacterium]|nr:MAG: ABC transporter permease [bacterium]
MAIFGLANSMPLEKKSGSFRRLRAAPFRAGQLIIGNGLFYMILALLSLTLMLALGIGIFDFEMRGSWLTFSIFTMLATVMMVGFGLLIGGWAQTENQSGPLSNLISFPMMFLSGTFFPAFCSRNGCKA